MNRIWRVGFLSTRTNPLLPYFLKRLSQLPEVSPVLIMDASGFSAKDAAIFEERTDGAFPAIDLEPFLVHIPVYTVPDHNHTATHQIVMQHRLDLLVNAGTPRRLGAALLKAPSRGILNSHPGILPKYRGATCCEWAIYYGDPVGVTAHFMDEGLDGGPIIFSEVLPITKGQTYTDVRVSLYELMMSVCIRAIRAIFEQGLSASQLPPQEYAPVFKPIPYLQLEEVKRKLAESASDDGDGAPQSDATINTLAMK